MNHQTKNRTWYPIFACLNIELYNIPHSCPSGRQIFAGFHPGGPWKTRVRLSHWERVHTSLEWIWNKRAVQQPREWRWIKTLAVIEISTNKRTPSLRGFQVENFFALYWNFYFIMNLCWMLYSFLIHFRIISAAKFILYFLIISWFSNLPQDLIYHLQMWDWMVNEWSMYSLLWIHIKSNTFMAPYKLFETCECNIPARNNFLYYWIIWNFTV